MPAVEVNGHPFWVEVAGPEGGRPLLLLCGLGMQLTFWTDPFVALLVGRGFRVVRMDNRDAGLSWGPDEIAPPPIDALERERAAGRIPDVPYRLEEMAADAVGVLDALGIGSAHIAGASMGGMIAQLVAAEHRDRALSLTSIMSNTGHPEVFGSTAAAIAALNKPRPDPLTDREGYLDGTTDFVEAVGSPGYPTDRATRRAFIAADLDRAYRLEGFLRQYAAILGSAPRDRRLAGVRVPAMVIHGGDDQLIPPAGGRATAEAIPGAELLVIPGMGHEIPAALEETIADAIARTAARARWSADRRET
ncbi:alpha/beta fold hydrolase [Acuticoccus sediminis]|uniref:alpha/beta fold hydrolase n=1 Tax=Acuticoccus sediminis TaxID=2184697 RepID=UPI001CFE9220|nr:alpha/beta hydrolase [Acuticoccus sediminis]